MTAPDRTTWSMDSDPTTGEPVLWHGDRAVLRESDLRRVTWPEYGDKLFDLLTAVLAPDEATIERLMRDVARRVDDVADEDWGAWAEDEPAMREQIRKEYMALLAALAGTSAQARHTDDDAAGGGEHG